MPAPVITKVPGPAGEITVLTADHYAEVGYTATVNGDEMWVPNTGRVTVMAPRAAFGSKTPNIPAEVGWSSIGSVDAGVAEAYAALITAAVKVARDMNAKVVPAA
jgi:hypothetical protein